MNYAGYMTETDWLTRNDLRPMLGSVRRKANSRKYRLFACACCRRVWHLIPDDRSRRAVEVAEAFADGQVGKKELAAARASSPARGEMRAADAAAKAAAHAAAAAAGQAAGYAAFSALEAAVAAGAARATVELEHAALWRDIIGNPFRPLVLDLSWLRWNDGCIVRLAHAIYEERRFEQIAILADAFLDAGCDDDQVLAHLHGPDPHVRGCWLIDAIRSTIIV